MKKLTGIQKQHIDSFIHLCNEKFKKNFTLNTDFSKFNVEKASLIVLNEDKTNKQYFASINIEKQLEILSNLIELPSGFLNISLDTKLNLVFLSIPKKEYLLLNIHGKIIHKTNNMKSKKTKDYMSFQEKVLCMKEFGIC